MADTLITNLITQKAPDFSAAAVSSNGQIVPNYTLSENI